MFNLYFIKRNLDYFFLFLLASVFQICFLFSIPIGFECDAGMYYLYSKGLIGIDGGVISPYRPFIYPLFLILTGFIYPGTFYITIITQSIIGIMIPIIVYEILKLYGRFYAISGSLLIILSCISFVGSKLILAEQLFSFAIILSVYFFLYYTNSNNKKYYYAFIVSSIITMLIRLEGQVLFYIGIFLISIICYIKNKDFKIILFGFGLAFSLFISYTTIRSVLLHDFSQIGVLQTGTGAQFYNKFFGKYVFNNSKNNSIMVNLINKNNGPATLEFYNILLESIIEYPDIYRNRKDALSQIIVDDANKNVNVYHELFGKYENSPLDLVNNIMVSERNLLTIQYSFFVPDILAKSLGANKADKLLKQVSFEAVLAHPQILTEIIDPAFTLIGLNIDPVKYLFETSFSKFDRVSDIFFNPGIFDYARTGFNAGNCAKNLLSSNMWYEYVIDKSITESEQSYFLLHVATKARNIIRFLCGLTIIILLPLILMNKLNIFSIFNLFLYFTISSLMFIISVSVAGGGSKYDIPFIPILIILSISMIYSCINSINVFKSSHLREKVYE